MTDHVTPKWARPSSWKVFRQLRTGGLASSGLLAEIDEFAQQCVLLQNDLEDERNRADSLAAQVEEAEERAKKLEEALDVLLGAIVEGSDGELALVPGSEGEVDTARAALSPQTASGEGA